LFCLLIDISVSTTVDDRIRLSFDVTILCNVVNSDTFEIRNYNVDGWIWSHYIDVKAYQAAVTSCFLFCQLCNSCLLLVIDM
jgi:hypothetical protein